MIDELLAKNPSDSLSRELNWMKIKLYRKLGQISDAIEVSKRFLNNQPSPEEDVLISVNLSQMYIQNRKPEEAIRYARRALEISPSAKDSLYSKVALRNAYCYSPNSTPKEILDLCYDILSGTNGVKLDVNSAFMSTLETMKDVCEIPSKDLDFVKTKLEYVVHHVDSIPNFSMRALSDLFLINYQEYGLWDTSYLDRMCEKYYSYLDDINKKSYLDLSDNCREVAEWYLGAKLHLLELSENDEDRLKHIRELVKFFSYDPNVRKETYAKDFESFCCYSYEIRQEYYPRVLEEESYLIMEGLETPDDIFAIFDRMNELLHEKLDRNQADLGHLTNHERSWYLGDYDNLISEAILYSDSDYIDVDGKYRKNAFEICSSYQGLLLATERQFINGKLKDTDTTAVGSYAYDAVVGQLNLTNDNSLYVSAVRFQLDEGNFMYGAFVFDKDMKYPHFVDLCSETDLKDQLSRGYDIYNDSSTYKLIFGSIESYLEKHDNVVIIPDGLLNTINFEALKTPDGNSFYQNKDLKRLSTIRENFTNQQSIRPDYAILFGGLQYDLTNKEYKKVRKTTPRESHGFRSVYSKIDSDRRNIEYLPESKAEIDILSQMLKKHHVDYKTYTGIYGTEEVFKSLSGRRIPILHLATHGFYYDKDQLEKAAYLEGYDKFSTYDYYESGLLHSGLILSGGAPAFNGVSSDRQEDGVLLGEEIASMDLSQTDLVVLSACETGMGDTTSEGLIGLQRAFKKAGAKTLILTLWPVNDACTRDFMAAFYENLLSGEDKHEAFFSAVDSIRETYKNPHLWAPFIMVD